MPSYQTIVRPDEKTTLLGGGDFFREHPELSNGPIIVEHYHDRARCAWDPEAGRRKRRTGCCAWLCSLICSIIFWTIVALVLLLFLLRASNRHNRLPSFWDLGSPADVPVSVTKCPSAPISYKTGELTYSFPVAANSNLDAFYFGQRWDRKGSPAKGAHFIQTAGQVIVQEASVGAADPITVDLDVKLSHDELADAISITREAGGLIFQSETSLPGFTGVMPCVSIVATISVASSANVSSFNIDTVVLPIELRNSLRLVSNNIFLRSTAGGISVETANLKSRKIEVKTTSNTISGSFPLADLLALETVSGPVTVDIMPKETVSDEDHPGTLLIRTASGNIKANTVTSALPYRAFDTQVHTVSGSVSGSFPLGTTSNINSASGAIDAAFHAAGYADNRACTVNSVSGSIHSTFYDGSFKLGTLRSNFHSQTGAVDVHFPAAWEGQVQAESQTGSIDVAGDGVHIVKDLTPYPGAGRIVVAEKGVGESNLSAQTLNAAITIRIG